MTVIWELNGKVHSGGRANCVVRGLIHFVVMQWRGIGGKEKKRSVEGCDAKTKSSVLTKWRANLKRPRCAHSTRGFVVLLVVEWISHCIQGTEQKRRICRLESQANQESENKGNWNKPHQPLLWQIMSAWVSKKYSSSQLARYILTRRHYLNGQPSLKYSDLQRQSTQTMMQILSAIHRFCEAESGRPRLKSKNENEIGWNRSSSACWKAISNGIQ